MEAAQICFSADRIADSLICIMRLLVLVTPLACVPAQRQRFVVAFHVLAMLAGKLVPAHEIL